MDNSNELLDEVLSDLFDKNGYLSSFGALVVCFYGIKFALDCCSHLLKSLNNYRYIVI